MNTLSFQSRIVLSVLTGLAALLFTGCGNLGVANPGTKISKSAYSYKAGGVDSLSNGGYANDIGYTCPSTVNVPPRPDYHGDGSDRYTACPSQNNTTDVSLHGLPYRSDSSLPYSQICVYPVQIIDQDRANPVWNEFQLPLYQCVDPNGASMKLSFPQTTFNGLIIVSASDRDAASLCIKSGQYDQCPPFSSGKIR